MTKAVSYLRCSSLGAVNGDTWDRQREAIARYCTAHDTEIEHEFKEEGVSGKLTETDRPAFTKMVETLLGNCCRIIIVERVDRLAREYKVQEHLLTYLAFKQIDVISAATEENVTAALMGDPMKRAMVQIQGIFAELEKNLLVAKLRKARDRIRAKGESCEGKKPYGRDDYEREILAKMQADRVLHGATYEGIASKLNALNLRPRNGEKWYPATIRRILNRQPLIARPEISDEAGNADNQPDSSPADKG